ncbi:MAG: TonB-dependent receptor plug domain-containing protein [Porticoccaceae bacterium]
MKINTSHLFPLRGKEMATGPAPLRVEKKPLAKRISVNCAVAALSTLFLADTAMAALEEIVVTARKKEESLQDVPVTVNAVSERTLDALKIDEVEELTSLVPNLTLQTSAGVGSGSSVRLRGIGNDANSAAFDTAVSFNIDGAQFNTGRIMQSAMFDVSQVEVLKGPQSLFFGKSSSAGVITLRSNDPTDEFEAEIAASYEFEEKGQQIDGFISGPLSDTVGARLAFRATEVDEIVKNTAGPAIVGGADGGGTFTAPSSSQPKSWRGNESQDVRLTLTWEASDNLNFNFKAHTGEYKQDGINLLADLVCLPGNSFTTGSITPIGALPYEADCDALDAEVQIGDMGDLLDNGGNLSDAKGSRPFFEQEITNITLKANYDISDELTLVSVSNWFDIESTGSDTFTFTTAPVGTTPYQQNTRENWSQEFRLESDLGGSFDFAVGAYYQERELSFNVSQNPLGLAFVAGLDNGSALDYYREHTTDTEAISFFGNVIFRPTDTIEISAGARWSREEHENDVDIILSHFAGTGILTPAGSTASAKFTDEMCHRK